MDTEGERIKELVAAAMKMMDCETCDGTGYVKKDDKQEDCPTCHGSGKTLRAALGARHSTKDVEIIQGVHDNAVALGAACEPGGYRANAAGKPQLRAAGCGCHEGDQVMDKVKRAELIAALVTDKHSGFKEGDEAFLEAVPDARLTELRTAAEARKADFDAHAKLENDARNMTARVKVVEEKLKVAEAKPTKEQWLENAPPEIKALLDKQAQQETEERDELIKKLKTLGANSEEELKAMPTPQLQTLAKYAKVQPVDFSGRGLPAQRNAATEDDEKEFAAPNPYEAGIKALQAKDSGKTAVN